MIMISTSNLGYQKILCWCIKIRSEEESLFFWKGWPAFVKDHSLELGDSLVFEYKGNSKFYVKIYGKNGYEKVWPSSDNDIVKPINPKNNKEQELKSKEKFTKCHTDFECGRDSFGYDKNEKICGSYKCVEPSTRRMAVNGRTWAPQEGCSSKADRPYFISTGKEKKEYQLEIPEKFLREVGGELASGVFLKDHRGILWPIGLRKADSRVWFGDGWEQFIEYHSISVQNFLIFRYDGNSQFDVSISNIRDKPAYEMKHFDDFRPHEDHNRGKRCQFNEEDRKASTYGFKSKYKNKRSTETESMSSSEERPTSGYKKQRSITDGRKTGELYDFEKSNPPKKKSEKSSPCQRNQRFHGFLSVSQSPKILPLIPCQRNQRIHRSSIHDKEKEESWETERQKETEEEDCVESFDVDSSSSSIYVLSAAQEASEFKSKCPFFTVVLRPAYINAYVYIPVEFYWMHLPEDMHGRMIKLQVSDGRTWLVKCLVQSNRKSIVLKLSKGVAEFMKSNNLVVGDVCIFEAIKTDIADIVFRVHISRQ